MVSKRQREIYDFVVAYARKHGYPPTVREIGAEVGLASPSTVHVHLAKLEEAGYLKRDPSKPRALELVGHDRSTTPPAGDVHVLPLVGEIAAGGPLLAEENVEDYIRVPEPLARGDGEFLLRVKGEIAAGGPLLAEENVEDYIRVPEPLARGDGEFLLRVKGESMIEAGIMPGDIVIVQRQETAQNGDVVVALVGDDESANEATVKTFHRDGGRIRLQPENSAMEPLYPEHVQILGRVIGLFRSMR